MKPGGGKAKGGGFEREMCRMLSGNVSGGKRDDIFWRTDSGARQTQMSKGKTKGVLSHVSGDLVAVHPQGNYFVRAWYVEMKFYKDLQILKFLFYQSGFIEKVWEDTKKKASKLKKKPLLLLKQNRLGSFAVMEWPKNRMYASKILAHLPSLGVALISLDNLDFSVFG